MSGPQDLSISLRAVTNRQHVLNGGPDGATFPGWFITVLENEGYGDVLSPVQLSFDQIKVITTKIDEIVDGTSRSKWRITHAAERCEKAMRESLEQQLANAERAAARIPELRQRLGLEDA